MKRYGMRTRKSVWATVLLLVAAANSGWTMELGTNFWNIQWSGWNHYFVGGVDWSTTTNPWRSDFLSDMAPYTAIRFMDWVPANPTSYVRYWSERIPKTANHYSTSGVAYEWQIDLCNRLGADMWVCVPHLTIEDYEANPTNNYWVSLANLLKQQLDPNLIIYLEYSNETWNSGFGQGTYCANRGVAMGFDPDGYSASFFFHVYAALRLHRVFMDVFSDQPWRIKTVIAGQTGTGWQGNKNWGCYCQMRALLNPTINPWGLVPDYYSIAPYAGAGLNGASANIRSEWTAAVAGSVEGITAVINTMTQHYTRVLPICLYECGQHILTNAHTFAHNPQSYDMYIEYLTAIDDNVVLGAHYNHVGAWASGGAWGAKESTWQSLADAHKYRGLRDYWLAYQVPPSAATSPSPANGAVLVSISADLSWVAATGATSHDVYLGTTSPPAFIGNQTSTTFELGTLAYETTYYWRIDEKNSHGTTTGTQWQFTTEGAPPPGQATGPYPANGATNVSRNADLAWTAGAYTTSHDVYFGTTAPPAFVRNQTSTKFDPQTMAASSTYYWRIDECNAAGLKTTGTQWSFTTGTDEGDGLVGLYYDNNDFTNYKLTRQDPAVSFSWASGSPDPAIGPDTFSVRWVGLVQPRYSETYTFTTFTSDGVRLWVDGNLIIDKWINQDTAVGWSGTAALQANQKYDIQMDYYENVGSATAYLRWSSASQATQTIPQGRLFSVWPVGDLNRNYFVNLADVDIFTDQWLTAGPEADFDKSGSVNFVDFAMMGEDWGL